MRVETHMMISNVKGEFSNVNGTVEFDGKDPRSIQVDATIDTTTINTREAQRDQHLKSAEYSPLGAWSRRLRDSILLSRRHGSFPVKKKEERKDL